MFQKPLVLDLGHPNAALAAVDRDGDGRLEIIAGDGLGHVEVWSHGADGTDGYGRNMLSFLWVYKASVVEHVNVGSNAVPQLVDVDRDGDLDLVVGAGDGRVRYFENLSQPRFPGPHHQNPAEFSAVGVGRNAAPQLVDADHDGDSDLVIGSEDGRIHYLERLQNSSFVLRDALESPFWGLDVGGNATPQLVDINGDGSWDLVVGCGAGTLHYFEGQANFTFLPRRGPGRNPFHEIRVGANSVPHLVDVDGDGALDLIVGDQTGDVHFLRGLPNLTFVPISGPDGGPFQGVHAGNGSAPQLVDVDGDGDLDLLVGTEDGTLHYFEGGSNLSFKLRDDPYQNPFHDIRVGPRAVPRLTRSGDGHWDLVVGGLLGEVRYFQGLRHGSLGPGFVRRAGRDENPFDAIDLGADAFPRLVDADGDGILDVVVGASDGRVHFFAGLPNGTFLRRQGLGHNPFHGIHVGSNSAPQLVDVDLDGRLDLVVGAGNGSVCYFQQVRGSSNSSDFAPRFGPGANPFYGITAGGRAAPQAIDFYGEGRLDLLLGDADGRVSFFEMAPRVTFVPDRTTFHGLSLANKSAAPHFVKIASSGHYDHYDIVVGDAEGILHWFESAGWGEWVLRGREEIPNPFSSISVGGHAAPQLVDYYGDGDGLLDLVVGDASGSVHFFERVTWVSFEERVGRGQNPFHGVQVNGYATPLLVDLDGQGDLELVVGDGRGHVRLFARPPNATNAVFWEPDPAFDKLNEGRPTGRGWDRAVPRALDLDDDGDLDLVVAYSNGRLRYFEGFSNLTFVARDGPGDNPLEGLLLGADPHPQFLDLDGDGDLDLVVGEKSGTLQYFERGGCTVPRACSGNGMCGRLFGRCRCLVGYAGEDCSVCSAGYQQRTPMFESAQWIPEQLYCDPCEAGRFSPKANSTCRACAEGKVSLESGSHRCRNCPPGQVPRGASSCEDCPLGMYASPSGGCHMHEAILVCVAAGAAVVAACCLWLWMRHRAKGDIEVAVRMKDANTLSTAVARGRTFRVKQQVLKDAEGVLHLLQNKYTDLGLILDGVAGNDLKLLRGSWLADHARSSRLQRQQDLPPDAFWTSEDLRAQQRLVLFVAVSYSWLHKVHPDPKGDHLRTLAHAIRLRLRMKGPGSVEDIALFLDFCSLAQNGEKGDPSDPQEGDVRTKEEQESFSKGLRQVNVLYANQLVEVWMMKWVPSEEPRSYMMRGWPFFEQAVAGLIKDSAKLIDVSPAVAQRVDWRDAFESGTGQRAPPLTPDQFDEEIGRRTFTNGKTDRDFVARKYRETFNEVVGNATTLWFSKLGWADAEAAQLASMLVRAGSLQQLYLGSNSISARGAMSLATAAKDCPELRGIDLSNNPIEEGQVDAILRRWDEAGKDPKALRLGRANGSPEVGVCTL